MRKWGKRGLILVVILLVYAGFKRVAREARANAKAVGVLDVSGTLWFADDWLEKIEELRKDPKIKAVVVRIQSPGGTVASAEEIYVALRRLAKTKPVVTSMGTLAASGGLYIAMAGDKVVADQGTITGSIGVRMEHVNAQEFLKFLKLDYETIKSGQFKDIASFQRPLTFEERQLLEEMMREVHQQFKAVVISSRKLEPQTVDGFADGRIFTGAKAKELGLVDEIGDLQHAIEVAAKLAKIEGEPEVIQTKEKGFHWIKALFSTVRASFSGPLACFLYP